MEKNKIDFAHKKSVAKKDIQPHHVHISFSLVIIIILSIIIILLIRPGFENFLLQREFSNLGENPQEILEQIQTITYANSQLRTNVSTLQTFSQELQKSNEELQSRVLFCQNERQELTQSLQLKDLETESQIQEIRSEYTQQLRIVESNKTQTRNTLQQVQNEYEQLKRNSARSICCRERVDDAGINSFSIINNRIVCSYSGDFDLTC